MTFTLTDTPKKPGLISSILLSLSIPSNKLLLSIIVLGLTESLILLRASSGFSSMSDNLNN